MNRLQRVAASLAPYSAAFLAVTIATFMTLQFTHSTIDALAATLYLLIIVATASRFGLACGIFAAALTSLTWVYYFVPPPGTLGVGAAGLVPLLVFFAVAVGAAVVTSTVRRQKEEAEGREREMSILYRLTMAVLSHTRLEDSLQVLADNVRDMCEGARCAFIIADQGTLHEAVGDFAPEAPRQDRVKQALESGEIQRPGAREAYVPLIVDRERVGVMAVESDVDLAAHETLLRTVANHGALVVQRSRLEHAAGEALGKLEAERLKASLLASVSHDLRTPLASIKAAASGIAMDDVTPDETTRRTLVRSIIGNADRLDRLVGNLLNMSRLEAGAWQPSKEFYPFSEILATVLGRLDENEAARIEVDMADSLPMVPLDGQQIEQVLWNLVENALKYSPAGSPMVLHVTVDHATLRVSLRDHGEGIPTGEERRIFQKFYRAHRGGERGAPGVGMGLAICREIVEAHGGHIRAENAPDGGAIFTFSLPTAEMEQLANVK